jgi:hypothetical protein
LVDSLQGYAGRPSLLQGTNFSLALSYAIYIFGLYYFLPAYGVNFLYFAQANLKNCSPSFGKYTLLRFLQA